MCEGSCLLLGNIEKKTNFIKQLLEIINQLTQFFHMVGSFEYAYLTFSMKAAIYHKDILKT